MELGLGPTIDGFRSAIAECGAQRRWERALLLLTKLERRQLHPDASIMAVAMRVCSMSAQWQQALHFLDVLQEKDVKMTARHCTLAISAMQASGDWARAFSLLAFMAQRGLPATGETYTWSIRTCAQASEWGRAFSLLDRMNKESIDPDEGTYRQLAVLCRKAVLWEHGLQLLADIRALQVPWDLSVALGAVSMACIRAREWQRAAAALAAFEGQPMETNYFLNLAQITVWQEQKQCDGWEAAFAWLAQKDCLDSLDDDIACPVIRACGSEWQKALEWMLALQEQGVAVTTNMYQQLVRMRAADDDDDEDYEDEEDFSLS
ncbi:MRL1 [Symbiodinium natans]|uniref:MRL1 protein n=1 Tax=Symbiodinium natans TaxID=878477 RepID=A0A812PKD9_9DINO|nr:MRL1 [Symbiodinium natans]